MQIDGVGLPGGSPHYFLNMPQPAEGQIIPLDHEQLIQSWNGISRWDFIKEHMTKRAVGKTVLVATAAFFSPGIAMRMTGMLAPQATILAEATSITAASWKCWKNPFALADIGVLGVQLGAGYWLYKELTNTAFPDVKSFQSWKIMRISVLQDIHMIPKDYWKDPFLKEYSCPITLTPIRFPVYELSEDSQGNKTVKQYYELGAIYAWLINHTTSPLTNNSLTPKDLIYDFEMARKIEARLIELQSQSPKKYYVIEGVV